MRQRSFEVSDDLHVVPAGKPSGQIQSADEKIRWLDIECPAPAELKALLEKFGVERWLIDRIQTVNPRHEIFETERAVYFSFPAPLAWRSNGYSSFHIVVVAGAVITVRDFAFDGFESWLHPRYSDRKVAANTVPGLLVWLFIALLSNDAERFFQLRDETEIVAQRLRAEPDDFDQRAVEDIAASADRLSVIMYDAQAVVQALHMVGNPIFGFNSHGVLLQKGVESLRTVREGLAALSRRLESINQQRSINIQRKTDHRIRLLTIFSVLFMPPTLITGIYGMNLRSIPGLDVSDAFAVVFALMLAIAVGMLLVFYRRGWFS
jgi:magnesium transporter